MTPQISGTMYRSHDHVITDTSSVQAVQAQTKLDWKVCELPVLIQGQRENRLFPHRKAIVRCDTGAPIEIVSDQFKIHQNEEMIAEMLDAARLGDIRIMSGGSLNDGAVIFLHGTVNRTFNAGIKAKLNDIVRLDFRLTGGHRPGTPRKLMAVAMRLACLNGMTVAANSSVIRTSHRKKISTNESAKMRTFIDDALEGFDQFGEKARKLAKFQFDRAMSQAFVLELLQPKLKADVHKITGHDWSDAARGKFVLDEIIAKYSKDLKIGNTAKNVLANIENQPGHTLAPNTAWNTFNAVTNFVDHKRGHTEEAVISSFSGDGATMKSRALDLAVEYTERYQ